MGFSSRKWAEKISKVASRLYFLIIIVRVPVFRFPCRISMCQTPIDVIVCQLIVSQSFPEVVIKALLYPGAIKRSFMEGKTVFDPHHLLNSFKPNTREAHASTDLKHLEIVAGSYLCVGGAFLGLLGRGRMSLFGLILIIWGVAKQTFSRNHANDPREAFCIYPQMMITTIIAFFSLKRNVRKLIRCCKFKSIAKWLKNCSKAKNI